MDEEIHKEALALADTVAKHTKPNDKIGYFDFLLGAVSPPSGHKRMRGGYKIWPEGSGDPSLTLRLMTLGNSTGVWPKANWSQQVAEALVAEGTPTTVFHGAGKGATSTQEVLRVLRDAPGIEPHAIFSLSGITDIGYLMLPPNNPFAQKYVRRVMNFLADTNLVSDVLFGYPVHRSPAANWCHNQRMAKIIANGLGIPYFVFLQPVQGYGKYKQTPEERKFFESKAKVVLHAIGKPYGDCVIEFYEEVKEIIKASPEDFSHVIDFTDVFSDCPGAYRDHRHQNEVGIAHLAKNMLPVVRECLLTSGIELPNAEISSRSGRLLK
ncbi:hypothetical protein [Phaeobacter gallaeciensis]|uniref:hypothetical protein n=1 Tax=Phaeobacter gallaeciensis TaxID=60890 RepID=UPI00237FAAC7|nr:hypothetical protein [Phaeobacter gallaeciensis]MDE4193119.1 hypothetical protein [Phaeobacter gallaeciensis]MDE4201440.1 hypothetical protein [Phaeobacter gallaeciensis]MDE4205620.1 hypothetical protein [Phaeobacter gallaeciensis]MDE4209797.1 hypothetical protein [Phaeobacter gallaeciensis]MDE4218164.1 hypothetical protein [Phaeobacter gallaeciensis]